MADRRRVKLGDVASEVTVGYVGTMVSEYAMDGVPFLRSLNVRPFRIDMTDIKFVNRDFNHRLRKSALRPGDVVTVRTGKPGQTAVIPDWLQEANCSDLVITRPGPNLDAHWLSYYLNWIAESQIASHLVGAVQQHFNVRSASSIVLDLPGIAEQRAIAEVLGALDDKIVANDRVGVLAAELATTLATFATETAAISEVANLSKRSVRPESFDGRVAHYSLPAFDAGALPEIVDRETIKSSKFVLLVPAVLISKLNPRFPRIWDVNALPADMALASTEFLVLEPECVSTSELWASLSQPEVLVDMRGMVAGTSGSHQRVKPADVMQLRIADPRTLPQEVSAQIRHLGLLVSAVRAESAQLVKTRDELLPLLMSGKVHVRLGGPSNQPADDEGK